MSAGHDTWTQAHDLALIYIALAYGTDHDLAASELTTIIEVMATWMPEAAPDEIREVVMEAMAVYVEGDAEEEVARSMHTLSDDLGDAEREQAVRDLVKIAASDGVVLSSEYSLISVFSDIWGVKEVGDAQMQQTTATVEDQPRWTLMHDVGLMYIIVAHGGDNDLTEKEVQAMIARFHTWQPDLDEQEIRAVLREALQYYAKQPSQEDLQQSVSFIKSNLSEMQRLAVLDDLVFIAEVEGKVSAYAQQMIRDLAKAWKLSVHLNGRA